MAEPSENTEPVRIQSLLDPLLYAHIARNAKLNCRSVSKEVEWMIKQYLDCSEHNYSFEQIKLLLDTSIAMNDKQMLWFREHAPELYAHGCKVNFRLPEAA